MIITISRVGELRPAGDNSIAEMIQIVLRTERGFGASMQSWYLRRHRWRTCLKTRGLCGTLLLVFISIRPRITTFVIVLAEFKRDAFPTCTPYPEREQSETRSQRDSTPKDRSPPQWPGFGT
jgi:hypothetical protein